MPSLISLLRSKFQDATQRAFPNLTLDEAGLITDVTQSTQCQFGHYQCNTAMKLTKILKLPPKKIAETIINFLDLQDQTIQSLEIAGPGFINLKLNIKFLSKKLDTLLRDQHFGIDPLIPQKKLIIDFSSPNVAKEMHVGHLRSTIIGDCLARLFEFLGYKVVRQNHIGDWGTAFGMLIAYLKEKEPAVLSGDEKTDLSHLMSWYKLSKKCFDENLEFKRQSQLEVVALQKGEITSKKAWEIICDISRRSYEEIYQLLDVEIHERGESFYNPFLPEIVADLEKKGLVEISDGAKCIFLEGHRNRDGQQLPLMIQKSDGGYNYATTDMAAIHHRLKHEKADRLIYVTDAGQATHFKMIFEAAEKAEYLDRTKISIDHVPFGLVLGPDGKKFRTRSGETEKLMDLLQTAINHAKTILTQRNPELEEQELNSLASSLGIGAVKYADLSNHRMSDYTFSYDRMLKLEGNTIAFLMYAYVRIMGIKRKASSNLNSLLSKTQMNLLHDSEIDLGLHLLRFEETLNLMTQELLPNRLTDFLYHLADKFNAFFRDCRVEGSLEQNERLLLCEATAKVLKQGLEILGIKVLSRM